MRMRRRSAIKLLGGAAATVALSSARFGRAAAAKPELRPNIILVIIDDMRWDEFGAGGHPYLQTPHIDRLAREGAAFSQAIHATPLCSPNRACLLTGQYVARHAVYNNADRSLLSHLMPTFPQDDGMGRQVAHGKRSHSAPGIRLLGELRRSGQDHRSGAVRERQTAEGAGLCD
jgi:Sulfatase